MRKRLTRAERDARYARRMQRQATNKYFVYLLYDEDNTCIYIGRSSDVPARLRAHYGDREKPWFTLVRRVSLDGPFTYHEVLRAERTAIELHQPTYNTMFTRRWRAA